MTIRNDAALEMLLNWYVAGGRFCAHCGKVNTSVCSHGCCSTCCLGGLCIGHREQRFRGYEPRELLLLHPARQ